MGVHCCIAFSDGTFELECISIVIRNKDYDLPICIDPPIYQMHAENMMLTHGKMSEKENLQSCTRKLKNIYTK